MITKNIRRISKGKSVTNKTSAAVKANDLQNDYKIITKKMITKNDYKKYSQDFQREVCY